MTADPRLTNCAEVRLRPIPRAVAAGLLSEPGAGRPAHWASLRWHPQYPLRETVEMLRMIAGAYEVLGSPPAVERSWWLHQIVVAGEVVGDVAFRGPPGPERPRLVEIGYAVVPALRRRGVATEACRLILRHAWRLGADLVVAEVADENAASVAVLARNGFVERGDGCFVLARPGR